MNKLVEIMSTTDFLAWSPSDDRLWQLVDGEPCAMAPANHSVVVTPGVTEILAPSNQAETWTGVGPTPPSRTCKRS